MLIILAHIYSAKDENIGKIMKELSHKEDRFTNLGGGPFLSIRFVNGAKVVILLVLINCRINLCIVLKIK